MSNKIYEIVTNQIIEKLEQGDIEKWVKPWNGKLPQNHISKKTYSGINLFIMYFFNETGCAEFITFKQIQELQKKNNKIQLRKGSKGMPVLFYTEYEKENEKADKTDKIFCARYYTVFQCNDVDGLEVKGDGIQEVMQAEEIIKKAPCKINHIKFSNRAFYNLTCDEINIPDKKQFKDEKAYYETVFHEMIHSTGHESRLNRLSNEQSELNKSDEYSFEELVAEIGAAFLCAKCGIHTTNHYAYIKGWLSKIKENPRALVSAASKAQKAVEYIIGA